MISELQENLLSHTHKLINNYKLRLKSKQLSEGNRK